MSHKSNIFLFSFGERGREEGQFNRPGGVICDKDGNIIVSDYFNHRIQVFKLISQVKSSGLQSKLKGEFLFCFGSKGRGEGQFRYPEGLTCDHDGNIVVCDTFNHRIQVFDPKGKFLFSFGSEGEEEGHFEHPKGVTCDHDGNIIVSDYYNHRIQVFDSKGVFLFSFGKKGEEEGQFQYPKSVTCDRDGNIIVSDTGNQRIQIFKFEPKAQIDLQSKITNKGDFLFSFGEYGKEKGQFYCPGGVICDHDGNIVICDTWNHRIQIFKLDTSSMYPIDLQSKFKFEPSIQPNSLQSKFDTKDKFIRSFGKYGEEEGEFDCPVGVTCDYDGNIIVCDTYNHRIQVFKGPSEVPTLLSLCWKHVDNLL
jgi:tripartite motif-containing protein 71